MLAPPRLFGHQSPGPGPHRGVQNHLPAGIHLDLGPDDGGPLVGHPELAEPFDLVAPEVDPERDFGCGWPQIEDRAADGQLPAVFDLVLASVAGSHQAVDEAGLIDDVAGAEEERPHFPCRGSQPLYQSPTGGHYHSRPAGRFGEAVQDPHPVAHRLDAGAEPLKRKGLPRREEFDLVWT